MTGGGGMQVVTETESIAGESPALPAPEAEQTHLSLVFHGNARDYFRLWIVNLCLTLFTLGIFSAWAKVRRKRYFYSHTELAGIPFQYLADPIPILKGRAVGAVLLLLWYAGTHFSLRLLLAVFIAGLLLSPWVMVRTAAFNARYSAYGNMTFQFSGRYRGAARALLLAGLLSLVTCGVGYPWAFVRLRRYFVEKVNFGGIRATYTARGGHLAGPFWLVFGGLVLFFAGTAVAASSGARIGKIMTPAVVAAYFAYALGYAYLQARTAQVNWRHTRLGPLRFRPDYRARDFVWLYLTNAAAILCSLGLLIPWAAVRMHRYRVTRLGVEQRDTLDVFSGYSAKSVQATGSEVADLFDFDVSL